jgi:hypothetical protein
MANPVAAHTFDFVRVYLSTRDLAAPGSGTWSNPVLLFDGTTDPDNFADMTTFSAGALTGDPSEPRGIIGRKDGNRTNTTLAFFGNGIPDTPQIVVPNGGEGSGYWDVSQGAWSSGGKLFILAQAPFTSPVQIVMYASSDGGVTWVGQDTSNGPSASGLNGKHAAIQRVDNTVYVFSSTDSGQTHFAIWGFDFTTGLWSASFAPITLSDFTGYGTDDWSNSLFKFPNGDFAVIYDATAHSTSVYLLWTAASGTWGSPILLPVGSGTPSYASSLMDVSFDFIHIFTYAGATVESAVNYSTITHPGNVLTSILAAIPAVVGTTSDGVGHCSIQNGMIFVPRDDQADFDNSVWVATLPVVTLVKELLPIPPGEEGQISLAALNGSGSGYAVGDTGTINGGEPGFPATYRVDGVSTGVIQAYSWSTLLGLGTGYAVGDTGVVNGGAGGADYKVLAVDMSGAITNVVLTNLGHGYTTGTKTTTAFTGVGSGFMLSVDAIYSGIFSLSVTDVGGGYSVANNVATTPGGGQPGVGTGLTINIVQVKGKTPSCAYMMFPNGYSLAGPPPTPGPPPLGAFCPTAASFLVGQPYSSQARVVGGIAPFTWVVLSGALPPGLTLSSSGLLLGTPTTPGTYSFVLQATDATGNTIDTPTCPVVIANCPDAL